MLGRPFLGIALGALLAGSIARDASAQDLDRIVAIVGNRPIFLSELRHRARPHLLRLDVTANQRIAAETDIFRRVLGRMIDERLEEREAAKRKIFVSEADVEQAIQRVANQTSVTPATLISEAKRNGISEQDYKDEIRRRLLEGKLLQLRGRGRIPRDEDGRRAYAEWVKEKSGPDGSVDLRIIVLKVALNATPAQKRESAKLAAEIAMRAREPGADFCELVKKHSQEPATKDTCGSKGPQRATMLFPEVAAATKGLKPGETAAPFFFKDPIGDDGFLVVQRAPPLPAYESVRDQMMERAFVEANDRARKEWLQELGEATYVDVRL